MELLVFFGDTGEIDFAGSSGVFDAEEEVRDLVEWDGHLSMVRKGMDLMQKTGEL